MKRATKTLVVMSMLLILPVAVFAQSEKTNWDSVYEKGDFVVSATAGIAFPFAIVAYPGAELILAGVDIGNLIPIDFGVAARGQVGFYNSSTLSYNYGWLTFGLGAFGTAHLSFNNLQDHFAPWLENFDFYVSLGLGANYFSYTGDWADVFTDSTRMRVGFASLEGVNWFFRDNMALRLEYAYWGYVGSQATVGVLFRL